MRTTDLETVKRSPIYREIPSAVLPAGLILASGDTGDANTETAIHLVYRDASDGAPKLEVWRMRPRLQPINVNVGGGSTQALIVDGRYTFIDELLMPPPQAGHADQVRKVRETRIRMGVAGIEVIVASGSFNGDSLMAIAKALVP